MPIVIAPLIIIAWGIYPRISEAKIKLVAPGGVLIAEQVSGLFWDVRGLSGIC